MNQLQDRVKEAMAATGLSQNALAKKIGMSSAVVSQWMASKYPGNIKSLEARVQAVMDAEADKASVRRFQAPFVSTSVSVGVYDMANLAQRDGEICVATGDAGIGKTRAVKEYVVDNPTAILIEVDPSTNAQVLLVKLHSALGLNSSGTMAQQVSDIVEKLTGSDRLVILDEAEYLSVKALEFIRRIHDHSYVGILLVGMPRLIENIRGRKRDFAQLYSRVGGYTKLEGIPVEEAASIVEAYYPDGVDVARLASVFYKAARGNVRTMAKLIVRVMRICEKRKLEPDADLIAEVSKMLIV